MDPKQNLTTPNPSQLPHHISTVDQKIFEEYARLNPIDPKSLHVSPFERFAGFIGDAWLNHKRVFIPVAATVALVLIVSPVLLLSSKGNNNQASNTGNEDEYAYYAEEDSENSDDGGYDEGASSDEQGSSNSIPTPTQVLQGIPLSSGMSDDETTPTPPEPMEPGGPVVQPPVPEDPPTNPPTPVPETPTGKVASVKVVSFNFAHWKPASSINDAVRNLSDQADIIGFQEFGPKSHREALNNVVNNCNSCGYGLYMPDISQGGNIPIIWKKSKFQVISRGSAKVYDAQRVEDGAGGPDVTAKHIIWLRLKEKSSGRVFVIINGHLIPSVEANGSPNNSKPKRLALYNKHISAMADKADQFRSKGTAVFITGDFNVNYRRDSEVQANIFPFKKMGSVGMWANWRWLGTLPGPTQGDGNRLIDYVFTSRSTKSIPVSHNILAKNGSDHHPVLSKIELR